MGRWGVGIYQNDIADDAKYVFLDLLRSRVSPAEATDQTIAFFAEADQYEDDSLDFWLALADVQWNYGILFPHVQERALRHIDQALQNLSGGKLDADQRKRVKVLIALRDKLRSPQPPVKKVKMKPLEPYRCTWKIGDVFAYLLESDLAKDKGLAGRYLLIQKIDEFSYEENIVPVVYWKLSPDESLPTLEQVDSQCAFIQTGDTNLEWCPFPVSGYDPAGNAKLIRERRAKHASQLNEQGLLSMYRNVLVVKSKKSIPKKLIFLGNLPTSKTPFNEFVPYSMFNQRTVRWKEVEPYLIEWYIKYHS